MNIQEFLKFVQGNKEAFMSQVNTLSLKSNCQSRKIGASIITLDNNQNIGVFTGVNTNPNKGSCRVQCRRKSLGFSSGEGLDHCDVIHAEMMAISSAIKYGVNFELATLFCSVAPCINCAKLIAVLKIPKIYYNYSYGNNELGLNYLRNYTYTEIEQVSANILIQNSLQEEINNINKRWNNIKKSL